jgi:hypothetical protein
LTLSSSGTISGTPSTPGESSGAVTASNGISPAATQNFTINVYSTYNWWTGHEGLSGDRALPTAIISADGLTNQLKYALGLDPFTNYNPSSASLPVVQTMNYSGTPYLTLTFTGVATDVTYTVVATSDLNLPSTSWTTLYTYKGVPAPGKVAVKDNQATTASSKRFMRLMVSP